MTAEDTTAEDMTAEGTTCAITGWSLYTPLGNSPEQVTRRLLAGERAAAYNTRFPSDTYACRLAAAIPDVPRPSAHARVLGRLGLFALEAGHSALSDAAISGSVRLGLFSAMGGLRAHWNDLMPALSGQRRDLSDSWQRGFKNLHPFWMLQHLSNNAHALLAQDICARGDGITMSGANAGAQALAAASRSLADRAIDVALVIAYDSLIEPETLLEMAERGALTPADVEGLRAPYDRLARGAVPGEAAAALVLERRDDAGSRTRATLAAVAAADGEKTEPNSTTLARAVRRLLQNSRVVDGCALAQPALDTAELRVLDQVVSPELRLTAIQAAMGLLGAATAPIQAIVLAVLLQRGQLPAIAALLEPAHPALVWRNEPTQQKSAIGLSAGAPGLLGAIRVSLEGIAARPLDPDS